ncbi:MAG TPA: M48 family metalloprotease [Terriglobales bacterium]|nr:M48 family metalloprotease [Terriglobales bacterium]
MREICRKVIAPAILTLLLMLIRGAASAQRCPTPERVPENFTADAVFARHIRSVLIPQTLPAAGSYEIGQETLQRLVRTLPASGLGIAWDLRIARDAGNMFSSPDGTIFVDESLAQFLGSQAGLWAAALSHEIVHVRRRDWARRNLLQKSLEEKQGSQLVLGETAALSGAWVDRSVSSSSLALCSQLMELEADADSLLLMAHAGFHPDFAPALHHALEAQPNQFRDLVDPSHPRWDERDEKLSKLLNAAGKEYDRLWPARYSSPGGNPPIVVYTGVASVKRLAEGASVLVVPLNCQNLAGSVEVVLRLNKTVDLTHSPFRQFTGCTSKKTLITFPLPAVDYKGHTRIEGDVSILDDRGIVLTRSATRVPAH